jgi:hypothetical protein
MFPTSVTARVVVAALTATTLSSCRSVSAPSPTLNAPTLAAPADDGIVSRPPALTVNNATSTETGARTYSFQMADSQMALGAESGLLVSVSGIAEGAGGQTAYQVGVALQPSRRYYWRARAVQNSAAGPWSNVFRFRTDVVPNRPPVIVSLAASDRAEVNTNMPVSAVVEDPETSPQSLVYEWTATGGTFTSSGPSATWRVPPVSQPVQHSITLTVIERYVVTDANGGTQTRENRTSASTSVHVNDSPGELTSLALTFLDDFVHSERTPAYCVRSFSDNCRGKAEEFVDIVNNRLNYINDPSRSSFSIASIGYNRPGSQATSATVLAPCNFAATDRRTGAFGVARGTCRLENVYENWRWYLCESRFDPPPAGVFDAFSRRFIF